MHTVTKTENYSHISQFTQQSDNMAVAFRKGWFDRDLFPRHRESNWARDDWLDEIRDWPSEWPKARDVFGKFIHNTDSWWHDWPSSWPRMDAVMPRFTAHLDRMDSNWRGDPFWKDLYPMWAEPIFKEGIDVNSSIVNDERKFAVAIDAYQFRPEEIQVKTLDDTLLIEGRHEEVRDRDNYTKMYFVRKYQLPGDIQPGDISSSIDSKGRLTVEAQKRAQALTGRERVIPIEGTSKYRTNSQTTNRTRYDSGYSNGYNTSGHRSYSPVQVDTHSGNTRNIRIEQEQSRASSRGEFRGESRGETRGESRGEYRNEFRNESRPEEYRQGHRDLRENILTREQELDETRNGRNGGYSSQESYYRTEKRGGLGVGGNTGGGLSPHNITTSNENRRYTNGTSDRRASFDTDRSQASPGRKVFDSIRDKFEKGFRSQSRGAESRAAESRHDSSYQGGYQRESESRNGYRVDSPASTSNGLLKTSRETDLPPRAESRTESVRSVKIVRTFN